MGWGNDPAQLSRVTEVAEQRHWLHTLCLETSTSLKGELKA